MSWEVGQDYGDFCNPNILAADASIWWSVDYFQRAGKLGNSHLLKFALSFLVIDKDMVNKK